MNILTPHPLPVHANVSYQRNGQAVNPVASLEEAFRRVDKNPQRMVSPILYADDDTTWRIDKIDGLWVVSILDGQGALLRRIPAHAIVQMAQRLERVMSEGRLGLDARA